MKDLSLTSSMEKSVENVLIKMNFKFLQSNNQYHEVLKETLKEFIATNTEERCARKLDIFNHKGKFKNYYKCLTKFQSIRQLVPFAKP